MKFWLGLQSHDATTNQSLTSPPSATLAARGSSWRFQPAACSSAAAARARHPRPLPSSTSSSLRRLKGSGSRRGVQGHVGGRVERVGQQSGSDRAAQQLNEWRAGIMTCFDVLRCLLVSSLLHIKQHASLGNFSVFSPESQVCETQSVYLS